MIIHSNYRVIKERLKRKKSRRKQFWRKILIISIGINIFFFSSAIIGAGYALRKSIKKGKFQDDVREFNRKLNRQFLGIFYRCKNYFVTDIPRMNIDIKFKNYQKILRKREEALKNNWLLLGNDDFVPASIRYKDEVIPVRLRLKGDLVDQIKGDKWSFRIRTTGDSGLKGMRRFSIHHPKFRTYAYEFAYLLNLRFEKILAPRYEFINVAINGKDKGIYALEESFAKEFIESQGRREGIIIKFNEDAYWEQLMNWPDNKEKIYSVHNPAYFLLGQRTWLNADLDIFTKNHIADDPNLAKQRDIALGLLANFISGNKKASEVFDIDLLTSFFAITYLWGGDHAFFWQNINFYYNPVTSKLEPIGFNAKAGGRITEKAFGESSKGKIFPDYPYGGADWVSRALQDSEVARKYVQACKRVSSPEYFHWLKDALEGPLSNQLKILWQEHSETINWEVIKFNQGFLRSVINPVRHIDLYVDDVITNVGENECFVKLSVSNLISLPVELIGMQIAKESLIPFPGNHKIIIEGMGSSQLLEAKKIYNYKIPINCKYIKESRLCKGVEIRAVTRLLGSDNNLFTKANIFPRPLFIEGIPLAPSIKKFLKDHPFAYFDTKTNTIHIKKGEWTITKDVVVPGGYVLVVHPGTTLRFGKDKFLLSFSPVRMIGTKQEKIELLAEEKKWAGMAVLLDDYNKSMLHNVVINHCGGVKSGGWVLTGAVTFYKSNVDLNQVVIENIFCEDALNLIQTEYRLRNSLVKDTVSDALDSDFSKGEIVNTIFNNIAADAIDLSGSQAKIKCVKVYSAGDKGLSIGEKSNVSVEDTIIEKAAFGIVSKDFSKAIVNNTEIKRAEFGLAAYQKKPEYGSASIEANNVQFDSVAKKVLCQKNSSVAIDGKKYLEQNLDIEKLYETSKTK